MQIGKIIGLLGALCLVVAGCHREIHVGVDGLEKNQNLVLLVSAKEMQ